MRAICQYFFRQNLCNHIVFLLNKTDCANPIDLSSAWSSQLTAAQGHYISKEFCTPEVEEERKEAVGNPNSIVYAVAVKTDVEILVSNLLRQISAACSLFLCWNGTIVCEVIGCRQTSADWPKEGLKAFVRCSTRGKS